MAFTLTAASRASLTAAVESLTTAIASWAAGTPFTASYSTGDGRSHSVNSVEEAFAAIDRIQVLLDRDAATGQPRGAYFKPRRFR